MGLSQSNREMIKDITRMGIRTAVLLKGEVLKKVDEETLRWGLKGLAVSRLMEKYFGRLVDGLEYVYLLNLLHLIYSLEGQLDFQVREYGLDSLKLEGKLAIVTGGARGNGLAAAKCLVGEGADIVIADICKDMKTIPYGMSTPESMAASVDEIKKLGRQALGIKCDVRKAIEELAVDGICGIY